MLLKQFIKRNVGLVIHKTNFFSFYLRNFARLIVTITRIIVTIVAVTVTLVALSTFWYSGLSHALITSFSTNAGGGEKDVLYYGKGKFVYKK